MFPIKDVMTSSIITAPKDMPIIDAAKLLVEKRITGIPIVDDDNNLIGILSEFDILGLLLNENVKDKCIDDCMTKKVISFDISTSAIDVCEFFIDNPSKRRVPIVEDGKLVGIVSRADIVKLIVKLRG